jgi:TPR repeat protein
MAMLTRLRLALCCAVALAGCATELAPPQPDPAAEAPAEDAEVAQVETPEEDYRKALAALESDDAARQAQAEAPLRSAAERGHVDAQFVLGLTLQTGKGVRQDMSEAVRWYRAAAEAGHLDAAYLLGLAYLRGRGVAPDDAEAVKWFARAAQKGHGPAAYHLALAHMLGRGAPRDDATALALLQRAADQGVPEAEYLLAVAYTNGRGVERDDAWAARWYGRAAQQGLPRAQYMMAVSAALGLGVPQDHVRAYAWARLAAAAGDPEARALADGLESRLQPDQKAAAERQSRSLRVIAGRSLTDQPTVRFVQLALKDLGYDPGEVDGFMGARTQAALSAWQRDAGMSPDGKLSAEAVVRLKRERLSKRAG